MNETGNMIYPVALSCICWIHRYPKRIVLDRFKIIYMMKGILDPRVQAFIYFFDYKFYNRIRESMNINLKKWYIDRRIQIIRVEGHEKNRSKWMASKILVGHPIPGPGKELAFCILAPLLLVFLFHTSCPST